MGGLYEALWIPNSWMHIPINKNFAEINKKSIGMFCRFQKKLYLCTRNSEEEQSELPQKADNFLETALVGEVAELVDALL